MYIHHIILIKRVMIYHKVIVKKQKRPPTTCTFHIS